MKGKPAALLAPVAMLAVALTWAAGLHAPFQYDDKVEVVGNPTIRVFTELGAIARYNVSRPLLIATYAVNWAVGGLDPVGYHAVSLAIHVLNVGLAGWLLQRILARTALASERAAWVAWAAAACWGLHPMAVQGVTYVTGRSDALCATWWLAASIAWLAGRDRWTLVLVACALLTKEVAVLLPAWLWILRPPAPGSRRAAVGMALLVAAGGVLRVGVMGWPRPESARGALDQVASQGDAWLGYVELWAGLYSQSILHDPTPSRAVGLVLAVGMVGVMALALGVRRRAAEGSGRWLGALAVVFAACWLLPSSAWPLKEGMAEHRAYLVGLPILAAACVALERRRALPLAGLFAAWCVIEARDQCQVWSSEARVWRAAVAMYPQSPDAAYGEADALRLARRWADAEKGYRRVLVLRPGDENAQVDLGIVLAEQGREDEAKATWDALTRTNPRSCAAHNNLAAWAIQRGDRRRAMDEYASAFRWCPDDPVALAGLGDLCWERGDTRLAVKYYRRYLEVLPDGAEAARLAARVAP